MVRGAAAVEGSGNQEGDPGEVVGGAATVAAAAAAASWAGLVAVAVGLVWVMMAAGGAVAAAPSARVAHCTPTCHSRRRVPTRSPLEP